jgi:hypothetical protein
MVKAPSSDGADPGVKIFRIVRVDRRLTRPIVQVWPQLECVQCIGGAGVLHDSVKRVSENRFEHGGSNG